MAKMARERAVKERRERKAEKKRAKKLGTFYGEALGGEEVHPDVVEAGDVGTVSTAETASDIPVESPAETPGVKL